MNLNPSAMSNDETPKYPRNTEDSKSEVSGFGAINLSLGVWYSDFAVPSNLGIRRHSSFSQFELVRNAD
jgi:hypothetical protein